MLKLPVVVLIGGGVGAAAVVGAAGAVGLTGALPEVVVFTGALPPVFMGALPVLTGALPPVGGVVVP